MIKQITLAFALLFSMSSFAMTGPLDGTYTCIERAEETHIGEVKVKLLSNKSYLLTLILGSNEYSNVVTSEKVILSLLYSTDKAFSERDSSHADVEIRGVVSDNRETLFVSYELDPFMSLREMARDIGIIETVRAKCIIQK